MEPRSGVRRVVLFDTTLRDGEQSPGAALTATGKLRLARQLARLGVDVIEAGFPAASPGDFEAVRRIASEVGRSEGDPAQRSPVICGLARALQPDIDRAWSAVSEATRPRIHTFLAVSDVHLRQKLSLSRRAALVRIRDAVSYAKGLCEDVEFSPEDATRADPGFLEEAVSTAIAAGASTINIPDTVGYALPDEFGRLIDRLIRRCDPCGREIVYSVHCHDDLGLAVANTMAALGAGALQAEVTVNGIGERAGNAALEEVVMALAVRGDRMAFETEIETVEIARTSRLVSDLTGLQVQANKAVVGKNAFAHASGIHQDGMLKDQSTYQIMRPEDIGLHRVDLVLGKHSGRHAFRARLAELGADVDETTLDIAFARFKGLCDQKKDVTDADLEALVADLQTRVDDQFRLADLQVVSGRPGMPTATVRVVSRSGEETVEAAVGTGPVDAAFRAIDSILGVNAHLVEYRVHGITEGIDAQGRVNVQVSNADGEVFGGFGADTDIIVASAKAYLNASNRLLMSRDVRSAGNDGERNADKRCNSHASVRSGI